MSPTPAWDASPSPTPSALAGETAASNAEAAIDQYRGGGRDPLLSSISDPALVRAEAAAVDVPVAAGGDQLPPGVPVTIKT